MPLKFVMLCVGIALQILTELLNYLAMWEVELSWGCAVPLR
jgi:hypothetical protein